MPTDLRPASTRLDGLTILRFVAAWWVFLFHLHKRVETDLGAVGPFIMNGHYAMDFFFVLSGAVLAFGYHALPPGAASVRQFYTARLARIYPAYVVVHLIALLFMTRFFTEHWAGWLYVNMLSAAGLQAWFPHALAHGANTGTWSISVEFFFYALFPFLLPLVKAALERAGPARLAVYLGLVVTFVGLADFAFEGIGTFPLYYCHPLLRLPQFVLGMLLGLLLVRPSSRPAALWLGLAGVAALLTYLAGSFHPPGNSTRAMGLVTPALAFLIFTTARMEQTSALRFRATLPGRVLVYLGESSYCLFLFHLVPMMWLDSRPGVAWVKAALETISPLQLWGIVIAVTLAGSLALHEFVEKPARRAWLRRARAATTPAAASVGAATTVAALASRDQA